MTGPGHGFNLSTEVFPNDLDCDDFNDRLKDLTLSGAGSQYDNNDYQRINILGDDHVVGVPLADLADASRRIVSALKIRERYMKITLQTFPESISSFLHQIKGIEVTDKCLDEISTKDNFERDNISNWSARVLVDEKKPTEYPQGPDTKDIKHTFKMEKGLFYIYDREGLIQLPYPVLDTFCRDLNELIALTADGPIKSFSYKRLCFLENKFKLHVLLNELSELKEQKKVPHRDFYNVRKVDTHIHAASCMNQKHMLRFMKSKLKQAPSDVVDINNGNPVTLEEVFKNMNITAYDLSTDLLDMHADRNTFQRFDKFNAKYNPIGESKLREIFIKTDNVCKGRYFAELIEEVSSDLEESKYQHAEPRISIYGKSISEWDNLADWAVTHNVCSPSMIWLIQIPRLFDIYQSKGLMNNFGEMLNNIFRPIVEVTLRPSSHPNLHRFLQHVAGFDTVDDESKFEHSRLTSSSPPPEEWTFAQNPSYAYYVYYIWANIVIINNLRKLRGLNTFTFRPHCGEAGPVSHLTVAFMTAENISHGLLLKKCPVLQYLYYLAQIGIAMSPLSNNSLFLDYPRNPLPVYHARGLMVSLSTDDPLQFHYTKEPLMEEYSIAAQVWKMNNCDLCELARYSVMMSGYPRETKHRWIGNYTQSGPEGNDVTKTNVPDVRVAYRTETLKEELGILFHANKQLSDL